MRTGGLLARVGKVIRSVAEGTLSALRFRDRSAGVCKMSSGLHNLRCYSRLLPAPLANIALTTLGEKSGDGSNVHSHVAQRFSYTRLSLALFYPPLSPSTRPPYPTLSPNALLLSHVNVYSGARDLHISSSTALIVLYRNRTSEHPMYYSSSRTHSSRAPSQGSLCKPSAYVCVCVAANAFCSIPGPIEVTDEVLLLSAQLLQRILIVHTRSSMPMHTPPCPTSLRTSSPSLEMLSASLGRSSSPRTPSPSSSQAPVPSDGIRYVLCHLLQNPRLNSRSGGKVAANLVEPGENALVLNSGYFGDSFTDW